MKVLSQQEFLLNLENSVSEQLPSKIIDYYLAGRPILSINSNQFSEQILEEFLSGNYENQLQILNPQRYRIENVATAFLSLCQK